jgi:hypothetical protein
MDLLELQIRLLKYGTISDPNEIVIYPVAAMFLILVSLAVWKEPQILISLISEFGKKK